MEDRPRSRDHKSQTIVSDGMMQTFKNAFYGLLFLRRKEDLCRAVDYCPMLMLLCNPCLSEGGY